MRKDEKIKTQGGVGGGRGGGGVFEKTSWIRNDRWEIEDEKSGKRTDGEL